MANFNRIQAYLLNRMTEEQRSSFEEEVRADEQLGIELETQRFEQQVVEDMEEEYFLERAKKLRTRPAEEVSEIKVRSLPLRKYLRLKYLLAVAASLALLIAAVFYLSLPTASEQLITMGYSEARLTYDGGYVPRGEISVQQFPQQYLDALKNREAGKALESVEYFEQIPESVDGKNIRALLNLGHSYLLVKQFQDAIESFNLVIASPNTINKEKEEAIYFKAIASFAQGDEPEAIAQLASLAEEGRNFEVLAKKTLEQLSK